MVIDGEEIDIANVLDNVWRTRACEIGDAELWELCRLAAEEIRRLREAPAHTSAD